MKLLAYDDLKSKGIPYSKIQLWRLEKDGRFPKRVRLGGGARYAWSEREIDNWIADRIRDRDAVAAA
jgi:prophage regulatory protein